MDPSIDIDYTTTRLSDLQSQMIKSFQIEDDRCVQTNNIDDCQQKMVIFILKQKLNSIQSNYSKLQIENEQLIQENLEQRSTINDLQHQITSLERQNHKQLSDTKQQIKVIINQHQQDIGTLKHQLEHTLNKYEDHISNLSQKIIDCKKKYDQQIFKIEDQWKSKYIRLKKKFKTCVIEDEWRVKYLELEQQMKPRKTLAQEGKIMVKMNNSCCNKHECNWFGHCHYAPAIILMIIMVILLIVWNKCVQFAKRSSWLLCRKVVWS